MAIGAGAGTWSLPPTPITFSPSIPLGSYQILLVADVDGIVAESNENNNGGSFPLTVVQVFAATNRRSDAQLQPDLALRDDMAVELEDLEANPPEDYLSKF